MFLFWNHKIKLSKMINMRLTVTECISERDPCWSMVNNNNNKNNSNSNDNGNNYKTLKSSKTDSATANFLSASRKSWNKVELLCEQQKPSLWNPKAKSLENDAFFCFISICKFGSFKNPFATNASLSELYFIFRRFILLVQTKKVISMNYGSSTSSWKPWRWGLTWYMRDEGDDEGYIHQSNLNRLTKLTSSSRSTEFKDKSHETSLIWSQRPSQ